LMNIQKKADKLEKELKAVLLERGGLEIS
jgi:hypothetical protein